ncbi:MAG: hypothetical protein QSU88_12655, partial [Candidatus Methanoperedens sp.]|nr:hypothetical protein [Candidatus Methanoperedens sp.]
GIPIPSTPNLKFTPILGIQEYDSRNCIVDILLSNPENNINDKANDANDVTKATVRACSRVFVKNVKIAPSEEITIINEIKATIMSLQI